MSQPSRQRHRTGSRLRRPHHHSQWKVIAPGIVDCRQGHAWGHGVNGIPMPTRGRAGPRLHALRNTRTWVGADPRRGAPRHMSGIEGRRRGASVGTGRGACGRCGTDSAEPVVGFWLLTQQMAGGVAGDRARPSPLLLRLLVIISVPLKLSGEGELVGAALLLLLLLLLLISII